MYMGNAMVNKGITKGTTLKTVNGHVPIENIKVGDYVLVANGDYIRVESIDSIGKIKSWKLNLRGTDLVVGDVTVKVFNSYWPKTSRVRMISLSEMSELLKKKHVRLYFPLPKEDCHPGSGARLPISPYLLGVLLGDGSFRYKNPFLVCADEHILKEITNILPPGHELKSVPLEGRENIFFRIVLTEGFKANEINRGVITLGLSGHYSHNKVIPEIYMNASYDDRLALVQGLMDTDGTAETKGGVRFCSTSKVMAGQLETLIRSFGGDVRITERTPEYTYKGEKKSGRVAYNVTIRFNDRWKLFRLPRKIVRVTGPSQYSDVLKRRIKSVIPHVEMDCYNVITEGSSGLVYNNYVVVNDNQW